LGVSTAPAQIRLTEAEEATLGEWGTFEQRIVERARIILLSHEGKTVKTIATTLNTRPARVSKWRQRFAKDRLLALSDALAAASPISTRPKRRSGFYPCSMSRRQ
jgi:hypothetical protein